MYRLHRLALAVPAIRRLREGRDALLVQRDALAAELRASAARLDAAGSALDAARSELETLRAEAARSKDEAAGLLSRHSSPFLHFNSDFDAEAMILRHAAPAVQPRPGHLTNYLGVAIDPKFFPTLLDGRAGEVEGPPIPGNWHADMAEFAAALRAVELAQGRFTMIELGCGWGCWMNNTGVAARALGLDVHLIGVEGDSGHIGFAREACATNGFGPEQVTLFHGIAARSPGVALFPRQDQPGHSWGSKPIFAPSEEQRQEALQSGAFDELPMVALADVAGPHGRIDLLHIDIQGGEADLVESCLPVLQEKVAFLLIGTHSRQIEGRLFDTLLQAGWRLEIERPGMLKLNDAQPYMWIDGVQGWRNPARTQPGAQDHPASVRHDLHGLREFQAFTSANPRLFDDAAERAMLDHCLQHGTSSQALGVCLPSEVQVIGPEAREHLMVRGLNSRQRAVAEEVFGFLHERTLGVDKVRIYGHEAITPLALLLRGRFPKFLGTEYARTAQEAEGLFPIPHADVCKCPFPNGSFDLIVSCDVFEHVPSIDDALHEAFRILAPGGRLIATFPFLHGQEASMRLASLAGDTVVHHVEAPIYHGNPMDVEGGSLVFELPGWEILQRAAQAGFARTAMRFICDQEKGILASSLGEAVRPKGVFVAVFDKA